MAKIEIKIKDDQGKTISKLKSIELELGNKTIYEIEREVEKLKKEMLPEISKQLMISSQKEFTAQEKKSGAPARRFPPSKDAPRRDYT